MHIENNEDQKIQNIDASAIIANWTRRLTQATIALVLVSLAGATVSAISAIISFYQWQEIHNGSKDTHDLAEASKKQAEAVVQEQRAWIGSGDASVDSFKNNRKIVTHLTFSNFGKQPTQIRQLTALFNYPLERWTDMLSYDLNRNTDECKRSNMNAGFDGGIMFPGQNFNNNFTSDFNANQEFIDGKRVVVRLDCFIYGVGKELKHTETCWVFAKNNESNKVEASTCPDGIFAE